LHTGSYTTVRDVRGSKFPPDRTYKNPLK